jgi:hypothetical protein
MLRRDRVRDWRSEVTDVALGQVKERAATRVAWSVLAIYAAGLASTGTLAVLSGSGAGDNVVLLYLPAFTAFMVVGALVVARRPDNAMGWLFSAIGLLSLGALVAMEYIHYAYIARPGGLPFAVLAAWYLAWAAFPVFGLTFAFTLLLFPTGRLLSPRWRSFAWLAGIQITAASVLAALQPTLPLEEEGRTIPNPIGISGLPLADQGTLGAVLNGMFTVASRRGFKTRQMTMASPTDGNRRNAMVGFCPGQTTRSFQAWRRRSRSLLLPLKLADPSAENSRPTPGGRYSRKT